MVDNLPDRQQALMEIRFMFLLICSIGLTPRYLTSADRYRRYNNRSEVDVELTSYDQHHHDHYPHLVVVLLVVVLFSVVCLLLVVVLLVAILFHSDTAGSRSVAGIAAGGSTAGVGIAEF